MNQLIQQPSKKSNGFIYITTNLINHKWYVGSCWCKNMDRSSYLGSGTLLFLAIKKYGRTNFKREVIYEYFGDNPFELKEIETLFLKSFEVKKHKDCYNIKDEGFGLPWGENKNAPESVRKLWSQNSAWRNNPPPHMDLLQKGREKFQKSEKGKSFAKKNAVHLINFQNSPEGKKNLARFIEFTKKPKTKNHRDSISKALKNYKKTDEHIQNLRESLIAGGKVKGSLNPRARECIRLDTLETFGYVNLLVENLNQDDSLKIKAKLSGVWDALTRTKNGGFYKQTVWVCFTTPRKSKPFSTLTKEGKERHNKIKQMLIEGYSFYEIQQKLKISYKQVKSIKMKYRINLDRNERHISLRIENQVIELLKNGYNLNEISRKLNIDSRVVARIKKQLNNN